MKPKILVILGPTATGKSDVAVKLAQKFNGEIISADSRQVYKGMDLGTGKITKREMWGIPHYLLDVANPKTQFSVAQFQKLAKDKINEILKRDKLPIICGGTGFYIDTLVNGLHFPEVPANKNLRKKLEKKSVGLLFTMLKKLDPARAKSIDKYNKVRLIRAIEIAQTLGKVPKIKSRHLYDSIYIGLDLPDLALRERINIRLKRRLEAGMMAEMKRLYKSGVSYRQLESFGLEYRNCALFLQKKITKKQLTENLEKEIWHFAKRQRTWFRRNHKIIWFNPLKKDTMTQIKKLVTTYSLSK